MAILLLGGNSVVNFIEKYILPEKYRKIDNLILQFSMRNCAKIATFQLFKHLSFTIYFCDKNSKNALRTPFMAR
jgi:hypothetical protein